MNCPACGRALSPITIGKLIVDACEGGCGGVWFDQFELQQVDDGKETAGEALLAIAVDPTVRVDAEARRKCPACKDVVMMRHFYGAKRKVVVDQCAGCAGFWLDAGELRALRGEFASGDEREQAYQEDFDQAVGNELDELTAAERARREKLRRVIDYIKRIGPSRSSVRLR